MKKLALKFSLISHENTSLDSCRSGLQLYMKKDSIAGVFLRISRNFSRPSFHRALPGDHFSSDLIHLMYDAITPIEPLFFILNLYLILTKKYACSRHKS